MPLPDSQMTNSEPPTRNVLLSGEKPIWCPHFASGMRAIDEVSLTAVWSLSRGMVGPLVERCGGVMAEMAV